MVREIERKCVGKVDGIWLHLDYGGSDGAPVTNEEVMVGEERVAD